MTQEFTTKTKERRISLKKVKLEGKKYGPNGRLLCRWCGKEVSPPRRTFCCDDCVHEWRIRSSTKYMREHIYIRDCGICNKCGTDTRRIRLQIEDKRAELFASYRKLWEESLEWTEFLKETKLTKKEVWKSLWHADHIIEVKNGGGQSGLENIQTLCLWCHKQKTARSSKK